MKRIFAALCIAVLAGTSAHAADTAASKPMTKQQQRMVDCNAKAKADGLKGAGRKAFMSKCLSNAGHAAAMGMKPPARAGMMHDKGAAQRQKMKDCNAQANAKGLMGADRKKFMRACLKG